MEIYWHDYASQMEDVKIRNASLTEKASIIGRTGLMLLSCGTGAWRVRSSMNSLAKQLNITCTANIGLMSIDYTCFDGDHCFSQSLCLTNTGVNTSKLNRLERFIHEFPENCENLSGEQLHAQLDEIEQLHGLYSPVALGFAAALACFYRQIPVGHVEVSSVAAACLVYVGALNLAEHFFSVSLQHEAGYICSMLFIIPGFPFITSGIDLAKLDMRSGLERLAYAIVIILVATVTAWIMALLFHLKPMDFPPLHLSAGTHLLLRLITSFGGVFGFSIMFNSPCSIAAAAAFIGAIANTLRLELVDFVAIPPAAAAFIGALTAGILASLLKNKLGYPRISITVPAIVIMVPGLYLYKAVYNLGIMSLTTSASWFASAMLIILALPLGLIFARIITDKSFRYCT